jgi:hypothetical protein
MDVAVEDIEIGLVVDGERFVGGIEPVTSITHLPHSQDFGLDLCGSESGDPGRTEDCFAYLGRCLV